MNEEELVALIESGDYDKISRALIYIEKGLKERPSRKLISKLVELCSDSDPDIRQEAVRAAGFYWQLPEAFPVLVGILDRGDEDELVVNAALFAISAMAQNKPELQSRTLSLLAHVSLNESIPQMVRDEAYGLALKLSGRLSENAYAKMGISHKVTIDKELMSSLCHEDDVADPEQGSE